MEWHFQNLRTGETHPADPSRTLIGTAGHVNIRTADGTPFVAALAVRYPAGWAVHGLADNPGVRFNGAPLRLTQQAPLRHGDVLEVGEDRLLFSAPGESVVERPEVEPPTCFAYITDPDGMQECRVVDHDLLVGRLPVCHVRYADTRLSRLNALLAAHNGRWYAHALAKGPIAVNRELVAGFATLHDGDELQVGPLRVRLEIRSAVPVEPRGASDPEESAAHEPYAGDEFLATDTVDPSNTDGPPDGADFRPAAIKLDKWLKLQGPSGSGGSSHGGLGAWLGAQKAKLSRFWFDTPEATAARYLRTAGKADEAFATLDRAIRARPDSPELLRELYRLYESLGWDDLAYRPVRQIEKLSAARGAPDPWALETLAKLCERLGATDRAMFERAVNYLTKLEKATGVSSAGERAAMMGRRALRDAGFSGPPKQGSNSE